MSDSASDSVASGAANTSADGMSATAAPAPRRVNLAPTPTSTIRYILLDVVDEEDYRVAYYQQTRTSCSFCRGTGNNPSGPGRCKNCNGKTWYEPILRVGAGRSRDLAEAIALARGELKRDKKSRDDKPKGEVSLDSVMVADYIWATEWGNNLPNRKQLSEALRVSLAEGNAAPSPDGVVL